MVWSRISSIQLKEFKSSAPETKAETINLGCGNSFSGGRCLTSDVINCVFDKPDDTKLCTQTMQMVKIPNSNPCKDQHHKFKCVFIEYGNEDECKVGCPTKCTGAKCAGNL